METINAIVECIADKHFIKIEIDGGDIKIPLSEDKPAEVKSAFNKLIKRIKDGEFEIELKDPGTDLFSQVANEYIKQLNREIREVHGEMKNLALVKEP